MKLCSISLLRFASLLNHLFHGFEHNYSELVMQLGETVSVAKCRAGSHLPLVLYLPSIEAWALNAVTVSSEEVQEGQAIGAGQAGSGPTPSRNAQPSLTPLKSYPASISPFRSLVPSCMLTLSSLP